MRTRCLSDASSGVGHEHIIQPGPVILDELKVHPNRLATSRMVGNAFSGDSTRMSSPFDVALTALIAGWPFKADSRDDPLRLLERQGDDVAAQSDL